MKVDSKIGSQLPSIDATKAKGPNKIGSEKSAKAEKSDSPANPAKVDLSDRAQMMQKAKEIASNNSIDEAKVARLQKLIDNGEYKTDAAAIADRLVDDHLNFPD